SLSSTSHPYTPKRCINCRAGLSFALRPALFGIDCLGLPRRRAEGRAVAQSVRRTNTYNDGAVTGTLRNPSNSAVAAAAAETRRALTPRHIRVATGRRHHACVHF